MLGERRWGGAGSRRGCRAGSTAMQGQRGPLGLAFEAFGREPCLWERALPLREGLLREGLERALRERAWREGLERGLGERAWREGYLSDGVVKGLLGEVARLARLALHLVQEDLQARG
eukprot:4264133-Prymnesium_polylepis.1